MRLPRFPRRLRRFLRARAIRASGLLERDWYLRRYPDVRESRANPEVHYLEHGADEGRDPNRLFDTKWYLEKNPDVRAAGANPLVHYLRHGAAEGRDPGPRFDSARYLELNPDVRRAGVNPLAHYLRHGAQSRYPPSLAPGDLPTFSPSTTSTRRPRVLIVAFLTIPQCARYRVWQRKRLLEALGIDCTVIDWTDTEEAADALRIHSVAIFFRVPGVPAHLALIAEAKRLGVRTFWEIDDLIFDDDAYRANGNIYRLDAALRRSVLDDVKLYRTALEACGDGIGSTRGVADAMQRAGARSVHVIENGLDSEMLDLARTLRSERPPSASGETVTIFYGTGSNVHDADFDCAAAGLRTVMRERPHVRLCIVGELTLPASFTDLGNRVERLTFMNYPRYMAALARADISLAPLEDTAFNDAKSNIKYIEASVLGLPSVCSPRETFKRVVEHGANAFLAETDGQWRDTLICLIDDAQVRQRVGQAALETVMRRYAPDVIARAQVAAFIDAACSPNGD